ncbi:hypothetical protein P4G83_28760 [Bacillus cereus]|nr:hypothetical protein [Bacillus cereus]
MKAKQSSKRTSWMTMIVGTTLAVLTCSLIVYGAMEKSDVSLSSAASGYPDVSPPTEVQLGGTTDNGVTFGGSTWGSLLVGYTGKNKIIQDSSEVTIPRLGSDRYGLIETNVTVKQTDESGKVVQTLQGKALVFANKRDTANAGYILVNPSEARTWVTVLNGNSSFVFDSSKSNVYPYTIEDVKTGQKFTAYNLADLANASGGKGDPPAGDGLTRIRDDLYLKRDGFIATPRPEGGITTDKTQYDIGETVNVTSWGADYSAYDKGLNIKEYYVVNVDTGQRWDFIVNGQTVKSTGAAALSARSFAAAADQNQPVVQAAATSAKKQTAAAPVELVDANLFPDTPHKNSHIPAAVAKLPKNAPALLVITNPPTDIPKAGENFAAGQVIQIGWDGAVVALDDPAAKTDSADQKRVAVTAVVWDKVNVEEAYTQDGVNIVVVSLKAATNQVKPVYIDESGKPFAEAEKLLLVFGRFGDPNKAQPMVFSKTDNKIFGVRKLDKEKATITVGEQIGEVVRTDKERIYFQLTIFPELQGKELSIPQPQ